MSEKKQSIGAWKKQTSKGQVISFTIDGKKYSMWENHYKKDDKHPDFNIVENEWKPQENEYSVPAERKTAKDNIAKEAGNDALEVAVNDDLPF